jgi:pimeloyl-ACP methyl ester carboxylesterase
LAYLVALDRRPVLPRFVGDGDDVAVLIHGYMATAGVMRPLRAHLERIPRVCTATFTYAPGRGVAEVAESLAGLLGALPAGCRIHLVGHSLGGLVARWYAQEAPVDPRIVQTVSIAAPFEGARGAELWPGVVARDVRRGSRVLRRLREGAGERGLPHFSIIGAADTAIPIDTRFALGDRWIVPECGHNGLLFHPEVAAAVAQCVLAKRQSADSDSR